QVPGEGEEILRARRELPRDDPGSTESRLRAVGVPDELARDMAAAHDDEMSASILAFYRSAEPNVARDWWPQTDGAARGEGLVLLLPDPPEDEAMSLEVAHRLGANTARLDGLDHCWMAQDPARVAAVLKDFWSEVGRTAG
ncbi:MAG TPA: alpha/beta hydrolase, partial [Actinomycetota bacterium]|nr:alpha/beta hydrolase [Actinomycetota bacterium]